MKKIAAALCLLLLAGCWDEPDGEIRRHTVSFFRSYPTGLCFALVKTTFWDRDAVFNVTEVECTERVRLWIEYAQR